MSKTLYYTLRIQWSDEDRAYLVALPEWEGHIVNWYAVTHGDTYAQAAKKGQEVLEFLVESAQEEGAPVPEPRLYRAPATV